MVSKNDDMSAINKLKTIEVLASAQSMNAIIVSLTNDGDMFLSTLARVNDLEVRYVGIAVDERRLEMIKCGELTLLDAFIGREGGWIDCKAKSPKANVMEAVYRDDDIPAVYMPPLARLYLEVGRATGYALRNRE
jgi:hypothetical protein